MNSNFYTKSSGAKHVGVYPAGSAPFQLRRSLFFLALLLFSCNISAVGHPCGRRDSVSDPMNAFIARLTVPHEVTPSTITTVRYDTVYYGCGDIESLEWPRSLHIPDTVQPVAESPDRAFVRTNILGDLALLPNIGLGIRLGKKWTVSADFYTQWLHHMGDARFYETRFGSLSLQYWPNAASGLRPLSGWHYGGYLQGGTYQLKRKTIGYQSPRFPWTFAVGAEGGYTFRLSRHIALDLYLGVGFIHSKYNKFYRGDGVYYLQRRVSRNIFAPTRMGVTFNYIIK